MAPRSRNSSGFRTVPLSYPIQWPPTSLSHLVFELDEEFQSPEDLRLAARAGAKEDRDQAKSEERLRTDTQDSKGWGKTEWGMTIEQQNQRAILNSGPFQEVQPLTIGDVDLRTIRAAQQHLENGALVTVDLVRQSIRLLPISDLT